MNKKIFMSVFVILLILILGIFMYKGFYTKQYNERKVLEREIQYDLGSDTEIKNNEIVINDLSVKLVEFMYYPDSNEDNNEKNKLLTTIEFSTKDNSYINFITFDYIVYDAENNILNTSLIPIDTFRKSYIKGFMKEKYNDTNYLNFGEHFVFNGPSIRSNITDTLDIVSKSFSSILDNEHFNSEQVTIILFNIKYDNNEIKNTDLKFILDL